MQNHSQYPHQNHAVADSNIIRIRPYRNIHKGLRALMMESLVKIGSLDVDQPEDLRIWLQTFNELLRVLHDHLTHENIFFHRAVAERAPQHVMDFDRDHAHHEQTIARLRSQIIAVQKAAFDNGQLACDIYLQLSRFIAENLFHMADEETTLTQVLCEHFTDAEILAIEQQLVASLSPEENHYYLKLMLPALTHQERTELLVNMQGAMPPAIFAGVLQLAEEVLDRKNWSRLASYFDIRTAPQITEASL